MTTLVDKQFPLLDLPAELVRNVLSHVTDPYTLNAVGRTSRLLRQHAQDDLLWQALLLRNAPNLKLDDLCKAHPNQTYRELFMEHHPYWFLTRHKLWCGDSPDQGELLVSEYDPKHRTINCTYLEVDAAEEPVSAKWEHNHAVNMNLTQPVVRLQAQPKLILYPNTSNNWTEEEIELGPEKDNAIKQLFAARPMPPALQMPSMALWPPMSIPAPERVRNDSRNSFTSRQHRPKNAAEASSSSFRIRDTRLLQSNFMAQPPRVQAVSNVITYGTLLPEAYTPTATKPWRGVWVGDYRDLGFEFILLVQPDGPVGEAGEDGFSGKLEAVKLTGDRQVPRGLTTFVCDDLSKETSLGIGPEDVFSGKRVVETRDYRVDENNSRTTREAKSKLIFVNDNRLALYLQEQDEIVFFERVDMDRFCLASDVAA